MILLTMLTNVVMTVSTNRSAAHFDYFDKAIARLKILFPVELILVNVVSRDTAFHD